MMNSKKTIHTKYTYGSKPKKVYSRRGMMLKVLVIFPLIGLVLGIYMLSLPSLPQFANNGAVEAASEVPQAETDRLIIPSADINVTYKAGDQEALRDGAWHRFPERGDPELGGNFILSGHRFVGHRNPFETMRKSYLYNIDKVQVGDEIIVHWKGKKYTYTAVKKYKVKPNQIEIEDPSDDAKLTLYSCTMGGTYDGREVIEAKPLVSQARDEQI